MPKYNPERQTIGNLLTMTNPPIVVPDWQRNYSWTTSEVETFWEDILRFDAQYDGDNIEEEEYFVGAIVIVDTVQEKLLLDGQQRIATAAILLSVIRDFLGHYNLDAAVRLSQRYLTDYDDATETFVYKINLNRYDRAFFKREILESRTQNYVAPEPEYESHRLIRRAREFFQQKFQTKREYIGQPLAFHKWALRILKLITNHVSVVAVVSSDEDNASNVFEALNDRGIGLSTPDLLRSLILRRSNEAHLEEILNLWGLILEIEPEAKLQDFLRHFWISHKGDVKSRSLYREIKAAVLEENTDSLEFSRNLTDASEIYQDILTASFPDSTLIASALSEINDLGAKVLYPPILSVLQTTSDNTEILRYLVHFLIAYVRHSLICKRANSLIENLMFSLASEIRNGLNDNHLQRIREFAPNDEIFKTSFQAVSIDHRPSARYLLSQIEQHLRTTEEVQVAGPERVHVEHIYPQTPLPEARWSQHSHYLNRLGNLTLLSRRLNCGLKNSAYAVKAATYGNSELLLTNRLPDTFTEWTPASIEARQLSLAEDAVQIWQFPE